MTDRGRLIGWTSLVAALSLLNYGSRAVAGPADRDALYKWSTVAGGAFEYTLLLGILLALSAGPGIRERLGLLQPASWKRALLLALGAIVAVYVFAAVLEPVLHAGREQGLTPTRWKPSHADAYGANFAVIAGIAPLVEELTFRGLGFHLLRRYGEWAAILLVGLAFGLVHGLVEGLPILVFFGACLAFVRSRTGSVYPGMLVHAVFNALALTLAVTT